MTRKPFAVNNGRPSGNHSLQSKRPGDRHELSLLNGTSEGALKGWETRRGNGGGGADRSQLLSMRPDTDDMTREASMLRDAKATNDKLVKREAGVADDDKKYDEGYQKHYDESVRLDMLKSKEVSASGGTSLTDAEDAELAAFQAAGKDSRYNYLSSKGRKHSNASEPAADALANGTSEGALKGWETRRAGGSSPNNPPSVAEAMGTGGLLNPNVIKRNVDASNGSGPPLLKRHEGGIQYLHADNKTYSNPIHPRSSTWDFPHDAKGMHPTLKERLVKGGAYKNSAQSEELLSNDGTSTKLDALANGEFVLFKKGQNSLGDIKDDAKKEPEDKDGKGPDDDNDEDDKKAWTPPWKKDGVANGKPCGDSHIPDGSTCHVGEGSGESPQARSVKVGSSSISGSVISAAIESAKRSGERVSIWKHEGQYGHNEPGGKQKTHPTYKTKLQPIAYAFPDGKIAQGIMGYDDYPKRGVKPRLHSEPFNPFGDSVSNAGNSAGAHEGWLTRRGAASSASDAANAMSKSEPVGDVARWHIRAAQLHDKSSSAHVDANPKYSKTGLYGSDFADAAKHHTERSREHGYMADDHRRMSANAMYKHNPKTGRDEVVGNAGNSEGAREGWLTRRGGVRAGDTFDHESGSGKHVKLTIQGQLDGQKNIELDLPKDVHTAIAAGSWKPNADFEKNSRGEDFHTIHGYEPVTKPGGIREKYGKGSEPDKANGLIGQNVSRAKAYYARARDFGDGTEAQNALKAKAESILKEIHSKYHPALVKAKAAHASSLGNRAYGVLLNSFRGGLLKNYQNDVQEMLDEVADYASNGETLPDDLREQYEEWMDEQN